MKRYESLAMSWMAGWFIFWWPITYATDGSLITGLINGIIGVLTTIMFLWFGRKWEECRW